MKVQSLVSMFILLLFLCSASFLVHAESGNTEETETSQEDGTTDAGETAAEESSGDNSDVEEAAEKINKLVKDLEEVEGIEDKEDAPTKSLEKDDIKVQSFGPYVFSINIEDLESSGLGNIVKNFLKAIDTNPQKLFGSENIKVRKSGQSGSLAELLDQKLDPKMEKLQAEYKKLLTKYDIDPDTDLGLGGVSSVVIESPGFTTNLPSKEFFDFFAGIMKHAKADDNASAEFYDVVKKMFEDMNSSSTTVLNKGNAENIDLKQFLSSKMKNGSKEIGDLDDLNKRIDQLEKRINDIIQKFESASSQ